MTIFSSFSANFPPHYHTILAINCVHESNWFTHLQQTRSVLWIHSLAYSLLIAPWQVHMGVAPSYCGELLLTPMAAISMSSQLTPAEGKIYSRTDIISDRRIQRSKHGSNCARSSEQQDMLALG